MMSFEEAYSSSKNFFLKNSISLGVLFGLMCIYLLLNMEEGFTNFAPFPESVGDGGGGAAPVKDNKEVIPAPKPLNQKPTQTMKKETDYLAANKANDANFLGSYSLLPDGMVPSNNFRNNSQLLAERPGSGNVQGIAGGEMFQALGDLESSKREVPQKRSKKTVSLKLIYAPWCGHSKRALPAFDKVAAEMDNTEIRGTQVRVEKYNSDDKPDIVKKYNVRGFPHYLLEVIEDGSVTKTVKVQVRDVDGLKKVILNNA